MKFSRILWINTNMKVGGSESSFAIGPKPLAQALVKNFPEIERELGINGNIDYIYIFSAIAILVLLMACINFMNLSTARSADRAREVGIRKLLSAPAKTSYNFCPSPSW